MLDPGKPLAGHQAPRAPRSARQAAGEKARATPPPSCDLYQHRQSHAAVGDLAAAFAGGLEFVQRLVDHHRRNPTAVSLVRGKPPAQTGAIDLLFLQAGLVVLCSKSRSAPWACSGTFNKGARCRQAPGEPPLLCSCATAPSACSAG